MLLRAIPVLLTAMPLLCSAADDVVRGSSESLEIQAKAYVGKESVKTLVGSDLDGFICIVEVKVTPLTDKPVSIRRDDFYLRSDKDGQRSQPFVPSQIAGQGAMVVKNRPNGYGILGDSNGPAYGGMGGPIGRMPGSGGSVGSGGSSDTGTNEVSVNKGDKDKKSPLLDLLKEKQLAEKETNEAYSGWLYFPLEGKHKPKDLELSYKGSAGKVTVHFQ